MNDKTESTRKALEGSQQRRQRPLSGEAIVAWAMPEWAAEILRQSLELDATSAAATPELRADIRRALDTITEARA